jgi:hypothetical protein
MSAITEHAVPATADSHTWQRAAESAANQGRKAAPLVFGKLEKLTRNRTAGARLLSSGQDLQVQVVEIRIEPDAAHALVRVSGKAEVECNSVTDQPRHITAAGVITVDIRLELGRFSLPPDSFGSAVVSDYQLGGCILTITGPTSVDRSEELALLIERVHQDLAFAATQQKGPRLAGINLALSGRE